MQLALEFSFRPQNMNNITDKIVSILFRQLRGEQVICLLVSIDKENVPERCNKWNCACNSKDSKCLLTPKLLISVHNLPYHISILGNSDVSVKQSRHEIAEVKVKKVSVGHKQGIASAYQLIHMHF